MTFIRQIMGCALVQSPSLSLEGQKLRKSLCTSDIFGTVTRTVAAVNSSGLAQTAGCRLLTFALSPMRVYLLSVTLCFVLFPRPQGIIWVSSLCHGSPQLKVTRSTLVTPWECTAYPKNTCMAVDTVLGARWRQNFQWWRYPLKPRLFSSQSLSFPI